MNIIKVCISAGCVSVAVSSGSSLLFYSHSLRINFLHACCLAGCINGNDDDVDDDDGAKRTIGAGSLSFLSAALATCVAVIVELYA